MEQNQLILKALPGEALSSGQLKLYAFAAFAPTLPLSQGKRSASGTPGTALCEGGGGSTTPIGCVELYNYDPINRRAAVGIVVSNEYRHQGHGLAMLQSLTQFCQENTSLHQLFADIAATNQPSIHIFQKAGYTLCGTMHDWVFRADKFIDTLRFQLIIKP